MTAIGASETSGLAPVGAQATNAATEQCPLSGVSDDDLYDRNEGTLLTRGREALLVSRR